MKYSYLIICIISCISAQNESTYQNLSTNIPENITRLKNTGRCDNCLLKNANLKGLKIKSLMLSDLTGADLQGADLTGCQLVRTRFDNANLEGSVLDNIIFDKTNAGRGSYPRFNNTNLKNVKARNSSFQNIQILNDTFQNNVDNADFSGSSFSIANIKNVDFSTANLANTNFSNASLTNIMLPENPEKIRGINFSHAIITGFQNCMNILSYQLGRIDDCAKKFCKLGVDLKDVGLDGTNADPCNLYP
ncbi:TPA: hypothetical protein DIC20_01430 [Candidatus Dependentiae bacterium]|nr:MAG: Pentapeptide repeat protein [candidate division TM6 bacterium GW2011_GWF2_36_131]KKQ03539.1 MAG: Pentapeptide repeat protein [candidate division TM6 bacterium GW2011_GWE2_36_25]KKQ20186.1 MAG: Pentapeptide repeat protein [candidate division TM6 bacterium GW2011_GWA2_36_9]HBR70727.1 hypothetical protein [Candidatus Dependentiae bacterium]HCU00347.1 hypothetical protein [Candidatus Dependentiae bacterium]